MTESGNFSDEDWSGPKPPEHVEDAFIRLSKQINPLFGGLSSLVEQQQTLQKAIQRSLDPLQDTFLRFAEQQRQFQEAADRLRQASLIDQSINRIVEQQRQIKLAIERSVSPIHETFQRLAQEGSLLEQAIKGSLPPLWRTLDHFVKQYRQIEEAFTRVADQARKEQDFLRYAEQRKRLQDLWGSAIAERFSQIPLDNAATLFSQFDKISNEIRNTSFEITSDEIKAEGLTVSIRDANARIQEFISENTSLADLARGQDQLTDQLQSLYAEIKKQKSPIQVLIYVILIPLLVSILYDAAIKPYIESQLPKLGRKEIERKVQEEAISLGLQKQDLRDLRMVLASTLNVRDAPSQKNSKVIGSLYKGQVVMLLSKERDWSLVEFSQDNVRVRGWVFKRYLKRIDLSPCRPRHRTH